MRRAENELASTALLIPLFVFLNRKIAYSENEGILKTLPKFAPSGDHEKQFFLLTLQLLLVFFNSKMFVEPPFALRYRGINFFNVRGL